MKTVEILGVPIAAANMAQAVSEIEQCIRNGPKAYITVANVHSVMESQYNEQLRHIHRKALMCTPDGMPLVRIGRHFGHRNMSRVRGPDLMLEVLGSSVEKGLTHFFYGGKEGVAELLRDRLVERFPGMRVVGAFSPPFRPLSEKEENELRDLFKELSPDITWVGLGCPKQEMWMAKYIQKLDTKVMVGVGAAFDFHAGLVKQAPRWMQTAGLEWFFRLCTEPRRLWKRYLVYNTLFIWHFALQYSSIKKCCKKNAL